MKIQCGDTFVELEVARGASLLDAVRAAGLPFAAPCAGKGTCGKCEVIVTDKSGVFAAQACKTPADGVLSIEIPDTAALVSLELFEPAAPKHAHGVAIDLGSSTLDAQLIDLETGKIVAKAGRMNPQIIYGVDVISRIEAAKAGHLPRLQQLILDALHAMIMQLCDAAALPPKRLSAITLAGNTIMQHLAAGLSPAGIGAYPYQPQSYFGEPVPLWADLPPAWLAPCISGYVGGDIVAGMLDNLLSACPRPSLLIDLGTNGEIALQTDTRAIAVSTAAGPVFEGMNIQCGMAALPGAIKSVSLGEVQGQLCVETVGGGDPKGICASGLIDIVALMLSQGLIDKTGRLCVTGDGESVSLGTHEIVITQKDIRNLQLAKAAIAAGIQVVLDAAGLAPTDIASLCIAGGFGLHINNQNAAALGLIPQALLGKTASIGNSSLAGAQRALLDPEIRAAMVKLARETEYIELSTNQNFTELFVDNMGF